MFLGSGSAFTSIEDNYQSNMLITSDTGKQLLIDCGSDARHAIRDFEINPMDIDAVYISHFHADHVGGLEWLAFTHKFNPKPKKPNLMIHPTMTKRLWDQTLSGGLETLKDERCTLETFFNMYPIENLEGFHWEDMYFQLIPTVHVYHNGQLIPSYGLLIQYRKQHIFITTDTQFTPDKLMPYYEKADIIFHDCETGPIKSCVHSDFESLKSLPEHIRNKIWLYHYSKALPKEAAQHGFLGFVKKGQIFDFS